MGVRGGSRRALRRFKTSPTDKITMKPIESKIFAFLFKYWLLRIPYVDTHFRTQSYYVVHILPSDQRTYGNGLGKHWIRHSIWEYSTVLFRSSKRAAKGWSTICSGSRKAKPLIWCPTRPAVPWRWCSKRAWGPAACHRLRVIASFGISKGNVGYLWSLLMCSITFVSFRFFNIASNRFLNVHLHYESVFKLTQRSKKEAESLEYCNTVASQVRSEKLFVDIIVLFESHLRHFSC